MAKENRPFVGVDLGGTSIKAGILDSDNKLLATHKLKTQGESGPAEVVERIAKAVLDTLQKAKLNPKDVGGLCVGAPGPIDINAGLVISAPNLRWNRFPLAQALSKTLAMPVTLDNDVNVGTWGEFVAGAGKGYEDVLGVFVGTGVGGGLVLGGQLYRGHFFTAGEIGHVVLQADSPRGHRTLENLASRTGIIFWLTQLIQANQSSKITQLTKGDLDAIKSRTLGQALAMEDPLTMEVLRRAAQYVGIAIANTVTTLSLPCTVLGGGLTDALGKQWVDWVRESFAAYVFPSTLRASKLVKGKLGDNAGTMGAAMLARERLSLKAPKIKVFHPKMGKTS